jgi:hypothetical protein
VEQALQQVLHQLTDKQTLAAAVAAVEVLALAAVHLEKGQVAPVS